MRSVASAFRAVFPSVAPGERARVAVAAAGFMCVASAVVVARTAGTTLFLDAYPASSLAPMYVATAGLLTAASFVVALLARRWSAARLISLTSVALLIAIVGLRLALASPWGGFRVLAYLLSDLVSKLPMTLFWIFAALVFNAREGKRLFGLIGAGGTLACVVAGTLVQPFTAAFGTENLLWLMAAQLAGFAALGLVYARLEPALAPAARNAASRRRGTRRTSATTRA